MNTVRDKVTSESPVDQTYSESIQAVGKSPTNTRRHMGIVGKEEVKCETENVTMLKYLYGYLQYF